MPPGRWTYTWDAEQRLVGIRYPGSTRFTEFRYDGLGRRTAIMEYNGSYNYTETRYLWCGERICQARNGSDAVIRRYYDEGELGPNAYYYAQDHLDSVRDLVNTSGQVLASYDYDPYGNPTRTEESGSARADYRYAGLFYHQPSGLYLTHYRVYDPVTARWLSRDPIGEMGGVNLYAYVEGNPVSRIDPFGLEGIGPWTFPPGPMRDVYANAGDGPLPYDPGYSPTPANCAHYPPSIRPFCEKTQDNPNTNCARKCLAGHWPGTWGGPSSDYIFWGFPQHPICWIECKMKPTDFCPR